MAPHADSTESTSPAPEHVDRLPGPERPPMSASPPRFLIIGAGSRGNSYARAVRHSTNGICVAVAEPIPYKRQALGQKYIWGKGSPQPGQEFEDWTDFLKFELERRKKAAAGETVPEGVDGVFICVQDNLHREVVVGLKVLDLHVMCEKPLATNLDDCVAIYKALLSKDPKAGQSKIVSIGHVLRYSPHNMLLRKLLLEDKAIGDVMSINHTEPVGWWHFSHSYVRGNWRKESTSAPSLLTKSCHDIDFLLWLLCSPPPNSAYTPPHLPSTITASGALQYFNKSRKPAAAGSATNCLSCPAEPDCMYSAKKIYLGPSLKGLDSGNTNWPVDIVLPDIEDFIAKGGKEYGVKALTAKLAEDYDKESLSAEEIASRNWFGRCVYEADNDVCDDEAVTLTWHADPLSTETQLSRGPKIATFHMVAFTQKICERYSNIYGTTGEIYADGNIITVTDFASGKVKKHYPHVADAAGTGHGGGDDGLARQYVLAVDRVKNFGEDVQACQEKYVGCGIEEIVRSHAVVFAAEEARRSKVVLDFPQWWKKEVDSLLEK